MSSDDPTPAGADIRPQAPGFFRFRLGGFVATALHDGIVARDRPNGFVKNASDEEVGAAFKEIGLPADKLTITFTPLLIDTGRQRVLIDTGFGEGGPPTTGKLKANLEAAGLKPEDIDMVIISHFHGDHISGLCNGDGSLRFPNAEIVVPEEEWAFWMDETHATSSPDALKANFASVQRIFGPIANELRRVAWGGEILPGLHTVAAPGHTPGHTAIAIESEGERMMFVGDITNNPYLFARHPDWQAVFDMDGAKAVETRRRLLDMAASKAMRISFYHAPFPATGYAVKSGAAYEFIPAMWRENY